MTRKTREEYYYGIANAAGKAPNSSGKGIVAIKDKYVVSVGHSTYCVTALESVLCSLLMNEVSSKDCKFYANYMLSNKEISLANAMGLKHIMQKENDEVRKTTLYNLM